MKQSRWRSPVAWSAFVALVLFILKTYGLLAPIGPHLLSLMIQPARIVFNLEGSKTPFKVFWYIYIAFPARKS